MTIETILALSTAVVALANGIWAHRRITAAKPQPPVTKAELYGPGTLAKWSPSQGPPPMAASVPPPASVPRVAPPPLAAPAPRPRPGPKVKR